MLIRQEESKKHANSATCVAYEYDFNEKEMNIALIEITGRYPDSGVVLNEKVKELIFVKNGSGKIFIEKNGFEVKENDSFMIFPNEKYYMEGQMNLIVACNPSWNLDQHKIIEE